MDILRSSLHSALYLPLQLALCFVILLELALGHPDQALLGIPAALMHMGFAALFAFLKGRKRQVVLLLSLALLLLSYWLVSPSFVFLLFINLVLLLEPVMHGFFLATLLSLGFLYGTDTLFLGGYLPFLLLLLFAQYHLTRLHQKETLHKELKRTQEERMEILLRQIHDLENEKVHMEAFTASEERNRLAQELHDRVGHTVSGSILSLEAALVLFKETPKKAEPLLKNTIDTLRNGMEDIRKTLRSVKPTKAELGIDALQHQLSKLEAQSGIQSYLTFDGDLAAITYPQWQVIQDTLREAFTNTMRHASATTFALDIRVYPGVLRIEYKDNGKGSPQVKKGMGISGMEERIAKAGGEILVDGSRGFSITLLFPRTTATPPTDDTDPKAVYKNTEGGTPHVHSYTARR